METGPADTPAQARPADTPEAYIARQPEARRAALAALRRTVLEHLPDGFEETMQYGMIAYVVPHRLYPAGYHVDPRQPLPFLAIANQKGHVSLYHLGLYADPALLSWTVSSLQAQGFGKPDMGKSCLRFRDPGRIPLGLIAELCARQSVVDYIRLYEAARGGRRR